MSFKFPNGSQFGISTAIAAAITASAVSNAAPPIATVATGAIDEGEVLVLESSWPLLNNLVTAAGTVTVGASDTVQLLGLDTTDPTLFPAGGASLKLAVASGFIDFDQQGEVSAAGGEQQYWQGQVLEDQSGRQISIPTFKNARTITIPLYYDPSKPWYAAAKSADLKKQPVVLRCKLPGGDTQYRYGYLSFDGDPSMNINTPMGCTATFTALGDTVLVEAA